MAKYFLQAKEGTKKNGGTWYGYAALLACNRWGEPEVQKEWFDNRDLFLNCVSSLFPGVAVSVHTVDDVLQSLSIDDNVTPLDIPASFFGKGV